MFFHIYGYLCKGIIVNFYFLQFVYFVCKTTAVYHWQFFQIICTIVFFLLFNRGIIKNAFYYLSIVLPSNIYNAYKAKLYKLPPIEVQQKEIQYPGWHKATTGKKFWRKWSGFFRKQMFEKFKMRDNWRYWHAKISVL